MNGLPDLRGVTIGKFAKKNIAEFSRVEMDNYRSLCKPLLRALIMAWNASVFIFISISFATVSTDDYIMKPCLSVWLWRA